MNAYKTYMDRQTISPQAHDRLLALEDTPAKKKSVSLQKWSALAACAALILGLGAHTLGRPGSPITPPDPAVVPPAAPPPHLCHSRNITTPVNG